MKIHISVCTATAVAVCLATRLSAQEPNLNDELLRVHRAPLGAMEKANKISGMDVTGLNGEKIGKVKDLAIDLENGRVVEVLVSAGGFMGMDRKLVAVPPQKFAWDNANKSLQLNLTQEELKDAPAFDIEQWRQDFENARIAERYARYQLKPYFLYDANFPVAASPKQAENTPPARRPKQPLGYVDKADKVVGMPVKNLTNDKLGKVENLMIDLPSGRIVAVVIATGGFLGMNNELSAVPPTSLYYNTEYDTLQFNITKEALLGAPHFNASDWAPISQPQYMARVYRAYEAEPYFTVNNADNTVLNVRDRNGETLTPMDQGTSKEDLKTTQLIRKEIMARKGLSTNARNIKVITLNGQVTLRGPVNTAEEKRILNDIALNVVGRNSTVFNRLEVKTPNEVSDTK